MQAAIDEKENIYCFISISFINNHNISRKILIPRSALKKIEIENNSLVKEDLLKKELTQFYGKKLFIFKKY